MRRRLLAALCGLLLMLNGCALELGGQGNAGPGQAGIMTVYRLSESREAGGLTAPELCPVPAGAAADIQTAIDLFAAPAETDGLSCALPEGVTVEGWTLDSGALTLTLSERFLDAAPMDRTAASLCAALTLCALEGVETVSVAAGGQTLFSGLVPADALLRDTDSDPFVRQLRLYFADGDGRYLASEYHSLTLDEDAAADRYVMEELLRGPNGGELTSAIPAGTELLSCRTEDGVCTVDLSAAFYENRPETALGERLALYSIVDSLTCLSQVDSVRILVEGEPVQTYVYRSLAEPLVRYERAIGPDADGQGALDADLYLPLPGLKETAPLPWPVTVEDKRSAPEAVLAALLTAAEPGYPVLFPGGGNPDGVTVTGGSCTVALPESFFASLPAETRALAVRSVVATLCALEDVDRVSFTVDHGPAVFDGTDWSGPWEASDLPAGR